MIRVHFSRNLLRHLEMPTQCDVEGTTVADVVANLEAQFPGLASYILHENGMLRPHVNIYLGESFLADRKGLSDDLSDVEDLYIMQALSGG